MEIVGYSIISTWHILLLLSIVFMIAEVFVPSFIFFPLGVGLLVSAVVSIWIPDPPEIIWISAGLMAVVFFALRRVVRPLMPEKQERTAGDRYLGKQVVVVSPLDHLRSGEVTLYGESWTALSWSDQDRFVQDEVALIKGIRGNKLLLVKITEEQEVKEQEQ